MQADILGLTVERPANTETTVMGAASAAGMGSLLLDGPLTLGTATTWNNTMAGPERDRLVSAWEDAVARCLDLA